MKASLTVAATRIEVRDNGAFLRHPCTDVSPKPWFLYLIECKDGSVYTGITVDVAGRYAAHLSGKGARYTRSHPPLRLLGYEVYPDRSLASQAEYRIKQMSAAEKRRYAAGLSGNE